MGRDLYPRDSVSSFCGTAEATPKGTPQKLAPAEVYAQQAIQVAYEEVTDTSDEYLDEMESKTKEIIILSGDASPTDLEMQPTVFGKPGPGPSRVSFSKEHSSLSRYDPCRRAELASAELEAAKLRTENLQLVSYCQELLQEMEELNQNWTLEKDGLLAYSERMTDTADDLNARLADKRLEIARCEEQNMKLRAQAQHLESLMRHAQALEFQARIEAGQTAEERAGWQFLAEERAVLMQELRLALAQAESHLDRESKGHKEAKWKLDALTWAFHELQENLHDERKARREAEQQLQDARTRLARRMRRLSLLMLVGIAGCAMKALNINPLSKLVPRFGFQRKQKAERQH